MPDEKPDDLEAVRTIVATLQRFQENDRERILRWTREKLGLPAERLGTHSTSDSPPRADSTSVQTLPDTERRDIKSYVAEKAPSSDNQFAATVAYYYRFVAPEAARKEAIAADDLQEACRLTGRTRLARPSQTLVNAHQAGVLDKSGDRGAYSISTVGENLVAVTLPSDGARIVRRPSGRKARGERKRTKKATSKSRGRAREAT